MQKIPGIGDEPNDGAEHSRDQQAARLIMDLIHALDYAGRTTRDQIAIESKWPVARAMAKPRITYFRNIVKLSPQSPFTQAAIPSPLRGAFDQRLTDVGRGAVAGWGRWRCDAVFPSRRSKPLRLGVPAARRGFLTAWAGARISGRRREAKALNGRFAAQPKGL